MNVAPKEPFAIYSPVTDLIWRALDTTGACRAPQITIDNHAWWEYRSFYDKYMNLVIRTAFPDEFKSFDSAQSKNKKFKSIKNDAIVKFSHFHIHHISTFVLWLN